MMSSPEETCPFVAPSPWKDGWVDAPDVRSVPCMQSTDPVTTGAADATSGTAPVGALFDSAYPALLRLSVPSSPAGPLSVSGNGHSIPPPGHRPTISPPGLASLVMSGPRTPLLDPPLSGMFRPPR